MYPKAPQYNSEDIDLRVILQAISRRWPLLVVLTLGAGILSALYLESVTPRYTAEARILVGTGDSVYRRPASVAVSEGSTQVLDKEAVGTQVEVLYSDDLAYEVAQKLNLHQNPDFNEALRPSGFLKRLAMRLGLLADPRDMSERERVLRRFKDGLTVFQVPDSRVIVVVYEASDPKVAARIANSLADVYLDWQRRERLEQTRAASQWLHQQVAQLREKVAASEAAVEAFRRKSGLYSGSNNVELSAQQLSELNSQLIEAKARRTEAYARARAIRDILRRGGQLDAASDVVRSPFIQRLLEQRVAVQRRISQLSATHLAAHPRMKRLRAELAGLQRQIRAEARKIILSLEQEAAIAGAREASLSASLNALKRQKGGRSADHIRLRELEREARANREVLQTFLERNGDASARVDINAVVPGAIVYSRAYPSSVPSFPKKLPIIILSMLATAMVVLFAIITKTLMAAGAGKGAAVKPPRDQDGDQGRDGTSTPTDTDENRPGHFGQTPPPTSELSGQVPPAQQTSLLPALEELPEFGKRQ